VSLGLLAVTIPLADPPMLPPEGNGAAADLATAQRSLKELQAARVEGYRVRATDVAPQGDMKSPLVFRPKIETQDPNQTVGDSNQMQFADRQCLNNQHGGGAAGGFGKVSAGGGDGMNGGGGIQTNIVIAF